MDYQQCCWLYCLERLTCLKGFMVGSSDLLFVDPASLVGWRSKVFIFVFYLFLILTHIKSFYFSNQLFVMLCVPIHVKIPYFELYEP